VIRRNDQDWRGYLPAGVGLGTGQDGDRLDLPNYPGKKLAQIQLLIGNNVAETFLLEIDKIWLK
jgi:hypothetical protein